MERGVKVQIEDLKKYILENAIRWSARCLERMQEIAVLDYSKVA